MSEQIREQVSAFLDGELPNSETELLLKRLTRDAELRESFGRYALIGETLRGASRTPLSRGFATRVNCAINGEPAATNLPALRVRPTRWWRPIAGAAVAAGVAAVAVVALQQRAVSPSSVTAQSLKSVESKEPISYTVPASTSEAPATAMPAARLTSYVFAHSKYSSILGQSHLLSDLLADSDDQVPAADQAGRGAVRDAAVRTAAGAGASDSAAMRTAGAGVAVPQPQRDTRIAP